MRIRNQNIKKNEDGTLTIRKLKYKFKVFDLTNANDSSFYVTSYLNEMFDNGYDLEREEFHENRAIFLHTKATWEELSDQQKKHLEKSTIIESYQAFRYQKRGKKG